VIIRGGARAGPVRLASHLLRTDTNELVTVDEMRGVAPRTVTEALRAMHAMAAGSRATRTLYHASINVRVSDAMTPDRWKRAIDELEKELGFTGQPRVVVRHVKQGREHVHIVWSRVDVARARAIHDGHNYRYHERVSRRLEREFGHQLTPGAHIDRDGRERPFRTPSLDQLQQAERTKIPTEQVREEMQEAWSHTDSGSAFKAAIEEKGYLLARGDKRDFVAVDIAGGTHSVPKRLDKITTAAVRARFADLEDFALPTVDQARELQQQRALALEDQQQAAEPAVSPERVEPEQLLDRLLRTQSYVTDADLSRGAERLTGADTPDAIQAVITRALRRDDLLLLRDEQGQVGYTIAAVREEEQQALAAARGLAGRRQRVFDPDMIQEVGKARGLSTEQQAALQHALGPERLAVITGRAGTGKTHTLAVINEIAATAGWHVVGLAPTNTLAQDLSESGIAETRTVHSLIWHLENAPNHPVARLDSRTLLAIDEAAMIDTHTLGLLLGAAERSGAKIILIGDDRQLASIQRGGLFADIRDEFGSAELRDVRRQKEIWARNASRAFAEGRFREGLELLDSRGQIHFAHDLDTARAELIQAWKQDTVAQRGNRFVFAYTNSEVNALNCAIQDVEIGHGRVTGLQEVRTDRGRLKLGEGDRILLHGTDKAAKLFNGAAGTVDRIEMQGDGHAIIVAHTDKGRRFAIDTRSFDQFGLGYAGTIYKGQGKTLDQAYLLHTHHWRDASSYVALTRSRGATELFVAESGVPDIATLARQMQRQQHRGSTLRFEAEPREAERKPAAEVQPDYTVGKGQREQVGPAHQKQPDPLAQVQAAEMAHLRRVQKDAARGEDIERDRLFQREQAQARAAIERRHQKEDVRIAASRAKEDRDRGKRGFMTMAMEAISKRRAQARQMAEASLQRERRQQDRERAEQRKREIAQAVRALTDEQRRRDATVRKERDKQFRAERAELAARQLSVVPRDLKQRQQDLTKDRGIERDDDDRGL
jgi:AAA domain/Relaxase/Mobilisation nuclease domain